MARPWQAPPPPSPSSPRTPGTAARAARGGGRAPAGPGVAAAAFPLQPSDSLHGRAGGLQPATGLARPAPEAEFRTVPAARAAFAPETPEDFVDAVWPHAERAARRLGVPADVLVAQAALETGWGQHMISDAAGENAFNLFGIKATGRWDGRQARVSTLEFVNGVPERRQEPFRVYDGLAQSFEDYVRLIESLPRYAEARTATTAADYARGLQAGGYATDPDYAAKILAIVERGLPGRPAPHERGFRDQVHTAAADNTPSELAARVRPAPGDEV
ncbi:MAG: flagellar assembly peptidoglycan hydrolase FlgJ [Gammaproteobacteria bacterium]|nr:flagellar assembly peptidoglycan hydrolase FlgJ [Gammaproteobacteria bacterium]